MDTDELSTETYNGIIIEAEKFSHDLTLQFGSLASGCKDEEEYLEKSLSLISELRSLDEDELYEDFFANPPNRQSLNNALERIVLNIATIRKIPIEQRHYEF